MRNAITQHHDFGCGAACVAFAANTTYSRAVVLLGEHRAARRGFYCPELVDALRRLGLAYEFKHVRLWKRDQIYREGAIVFVADYPYGYGHYFVRHKGMWMDPWINLPFDRNITDARSGFRRRLPGSPTYAIFPSEQPRK